MRVLKKVVVAEVTVTSEVKLVCLVESSYSVFVDGKSSGT